MSHANSAHPSLLSRIFKRWAEITYDNPKLCLLVCLLFLGFSFVQMLSLKLDMSSEAMLHESDPARVNYAAFRGQFGREDAIILSLPTQGQIDDALLKNLNLLQGEIENNVPYLKKITSLINARDT